MSKSCHAFRAPRTYTDSFKCRLLCLASTSLFGLLALAAPAAAPAALASGKLNGVDDDAIKYDIAAANNGSIGAYKFVKLNGSFSGEYDIGPNGEAASGTLDTNQKYTFPKPTKGLTKGFYTLEATEASQVIDDAFVTLDWDLKKSENENFTGVTQKFTVVHVDATLTTDITFRQGVFLTDISIDIDDKKTKPDGKPTLSGGTTEVVDVRGRSPIDFRQEGIALKQASFTDITAMLEHHGLTWRAVYSGPLAPGTEVIKFK